MNCEPFDPKADAKYLSSLVNLSNTLLSYLKNSSMFLALQRKSRWHIDGGGHRSRTGERLGHVHRGVNITVDGGSRTRRHDGLQDFGTGHSLRRNGDRNVNGARDDVTLGYRGCGDGDGGGVGRRCEDHVCALVDSSLADAGFGSRCTDKHATVNGHCLVCWGGKAAYAIRDAAGWCHGSCRGEVDCR